MVSVRKTVVSMENTKAWIKPTNNSRSKNGKGAKRGIRKAIMVSNTSPAKILPNKRKANDMTLVNSPINSRIPTEK